MSTVFVPHLPTRWDAELEVRVAALDISKAVDFGSPIVIVHQEVNLAILDPAIIIIRERLATAAADDFILAVGDPVLIAVAVHVMLTRNRVANVLRWSRTNKNYQHIQIT